MIEVRKDWKNERGPVVALYVVFDRPGGRTNFGAREALWLDLAEQVICSANGSDRVYFHPRPDREREPAGDYTPETLRQFLAELKPGELRPGCRLAWKASEEEQAILAEFLAKL